MHYQPIPNWMRAIPLQVTPNTLLVIGCVMRMLFIINHLKYIIMNMNIEININDYLSEEEKKELVIQTFKETVKRELLDGHSDNTIQSDSEIQRVIGNISHEIVMQELKQYIPEYEDLLKTKVKKQLTETNLNFEIFRTKSDWSNTESLAVTYINETVKECKETFKTRIKEAIENYDLSKVITDEVSSVFDEMAGNFYKLSELFHAK